MIKFSLNLKFISNNNKDNRELSKIKMIIMMVRDIFQLFHHLHIFLKTIALKHSNKKFSHILATIDTSEI